ncbi:SusC/RagA family TonB-linked outer membrane protein [Adhaeribacter rhizoryzae]|nr:TonB-dependent receptor [Adhaeribacter rhizoryzae]
MKQTLRKKKWLTTAIGLAFSLPWVQAQQVSFSSVAANTRQTHTVQANKASYTLQEVLNRLETTQKVRFMYDPELIQHKYIAKSGSDIKKGRLEAELKVLLAPLNLGVKKAAENYFVIQQLATPVTTAAPASTTDAKQITVKGKVTAKEDNSPLPGVTVLVKGTTNGTATTTDGNYSLVVAENNATLVFSFVGYKTQEVAINNRTQVNVALEVDASSLEEVQIVAYGEQKKESVVGAISTVKVKEITTPTRNLQNALAGKVAGVIAVQRSGEPGYDDAQFWIRGVSTFGGGANPLILVDGVERPISNIEPEEIETFSILKDAAATAVYGIRGANGVILVTTRRGTKEKPSISLKVERGIVGATMLPDLVDGPTYLELYNEAQLATNPNFVTPYTPEYIEKTRSGEDPYLYPNVNWMDMMMKDWSNNQRANLNITGGGDVAKYFVSATYYDEDGIWKGDNLNTYNTNIKLKRYNFRANTDINLNKDTELSLGIGGILVTSNYPGRSAADIWGNNGGIMMNTPIGYAPFYPDPTNPNKIIYGGVNGIGNPYQHLTGAGFTTEWRNNIQSDLTLRHDLSRFVKGLKLMGKFAFDGYNYHNIQRVRGSNDDSGDRWALNGRDANGNLILTKFYDGVDDLPYNRNSGGNRRIYTQANINYDRTFGNHTIAGLVLYNQQDYQVGDAANAINALPFRLQGLVSRVSYGFKERYFAEFNAGYNGSENFAKGHRYGFFPAYALGWIVSEEPFFKNNINLVDFLKFRGSFGYKGNDQLGQSNGSVRRFAYITTVGTGNGGYTFGDANQNGFNGRGEDQWGANLTWEREREINVGIEARFLRGFYLQADVFKRHRTGIFLQRNALPAIMGLQNNPWGNLGEFENQGIDATLEYRKKIGQVDVTLRGNYTFARNNLLNNDEPDWAYTYQNRKGKRLNQPFGLIADGLFQDQEDINASPTHTFGPVRPGDLKYKDINGDGVVNAFDEVAIGNPSTPEIVYGFGTTLNYKGFDLSAFFQGTGNMDFMLSGNGWFPFVQGGLRGNLNENALDRWTPENPSQDVLFPRLSFGPNTNNYRSSTWWQRDASYLRLKTTELGYTIPKVITQRLKINTLRIYVSGFNLFTWSKFDYWDPELGNGNGSAYPIQRNFNAGINLNL